MRHPGILCLVLLACLVCQSRAASALDTVQLPPNNTYSLEPIAALQKWGALIKCAAVGVRPVLHAIAFLCPP